MRRTVGLALMAVLVTVGCSPKMTEDEMRAICLYNRKQMAAAQKQWEQARGRQLGDPPVLEEIASYLKTSKPLVCPSGGTYSYHETGAGPSCNLHGNVDRSYNEESVVRRRRLALQRNADRFPLVPVATNVDGVRFCTLDLNDTRTEMDGVVYHALRFRTPPVTGPLVWAFRTAEPCQWYIVPVTGTMQGFGTYDCFTLPAAVEGLGKEGDDVMMQYLGERYLRTDAEYILWFNFGRGVDARVTCSLAIFSKEKVPSYLLIFPEVFKAKPEPRPVP